jgi:putative transposase
VIARELAVDFPQVPVTRICSLLDVSRATYYRPEVVRQESDWIREVVARIEFLILKFAGYGYRRVAIQLRKDGYEIGQKAVRRLMREHSLLCQIKRRWVRTTDSKHGNKCYPNLAKDFALTGCNQLWVTDITYIRLPSGFCYLATILDAYSRKAVAWHLSRNIDAKLVLTALEKALSLRNPPPGWIHHSDRGVQYACRGYVEAVLATQGQISMSSKACPYDNAKAESFFATLKKEEVHMEDYRSFAEAELAIGRYIDQIYNAERLHSSLGYESPDQFEAKQPKQRKEHATT